MIVLNSKMSIYDMIKQYPEISDIMVELGFESIIKPGMLASMGKVMTLEKGSKMKNIEWDLIVKTFDKFGFEVQRS